MKLPDRLKLSTVYSGPDYPGCINSGLEPCILHSRNLESAKKLGLTKKRFVVGPRILVDAFLETPKHYAALKNTWKPNSKANRCVYLYADAAGAKRKFEELCAEVQAQRDAENAKRKALQAKARTGNPTAMVNLAFHMIDN